MASNPKLRAKDGGWASFRAAAMAALFDASAWSGKPRQKRTVPKLVCDVTSGLIVSVIVTPGAPPTFSAKAATSTIPIVFAHGVDPVESGLFATLSHPGGNITGVSLLQAQLVGKRLGLLHELLPTATVVALLVNPSNRVADSEVKNLQDAARAPGLELHFLQARTASEIKAGFQTLAELRANAIVVSADTFFTS